MVIHNTMLPNYYELQFILTGSFNIRGSIFFFFCPLLPLHLPGIIVACSHAMVGLYFIKSDNLFEELFVMILSEARRPGRHFHASFSRHAPFSANSNPFPQRGTTIYPSPKLSTAID
jgi:hypothetical protein